VEIVPLALQNRDADEPGSRCTGRPGGPPFCPGSPFPCSRMRGTGVHSAGDLDGDALGPKRRPSARRKARQASWPILPLPWHRGHGSTVRRQTPDRRAAACPPQSGPSLQTTSRLRPGPSTDVARRVFLQGLTSVGKTPHRVDKIDYPNCSGGLLPSGERRFAHPLGRRKGRKGNLPSRRIPPGSKIRPTEIETAKSGSRLADLPSLGRNRHGPN